MISNRALQTNEIINVSQFKTQLIGFGDNLLTSQIKRFDSPRHLSLQMKHETSTI